MLRFLIKLIIVCAICFIIYLILTHINGGKYWIFIQREATSAYDALRFWISLIFK